MKTPSPAFKITRISSSAKGTLCPVHVAFFTALTACTAHCAHPANQRGVSLSAQIPVYVNHAHATYEHDVVERKERGREHSADVFPLVSNGRRTQ